MSIILVIEDDSAIQAALSQALTGRGHTVAIASTGMTGLEHVLLARPDIVLLDLGLPDVDGLTMISMIRAASSVPILVITARADDASIVQALDSGADDYVLKPFGIEQVAARIRALLRRGGPRGALDPIRIGALVIDARSRVVTLGEETIELARREFDLLLALAQRPGEVVTKKQLLAEVWPHTDGSSDRTVDVHLSWLRHKLGETAAEPRYLISVRGVGVRLVDPERS